VYFLFFLRFDPETYLETSPEVPGLVSDKQKAFPVLKRVSAPAAATNPVLADVASAAGVAQLTMTKQGVTTQISPTIPAISISANSFLMQQDDADASLNDDVDDVVEEEDDEEGENLPPKLPMPIGKMNCSLTRTVLAKLIRFHCGNQVNQTC